MEAPVEPTLNGPGNATTESESSTPVDTPASSEVDEGQSFLTEVYSKADVAHIDLIEKKFLEQFPADWSKKYSNGAALQDAMQMFGSEYGVSVARCGHKIECTRATREKSKPNALAPGSKPKKKRKRETQRCGCLFSCNFAGGTKANPEVHINKVSYRHSDSCTPSVTQLMNAKRQSGAYLSLIKSDLSCLNLCIQMAKDRQHIEPNMLRTALGSIPGFPAAVGISSSTLYNCRLRILKIANESRDSSLLQCDLGQSAEALVAEGNDTPLDEITPDYVDMAYEIEGDTVSNSNSNSVSDPIRQEVAAQAAKRRHTLVHGSNTNSNGNAANENTQQGRMVLETELACSSCGASMHWSSAKFCWSCGEQMV